MSDLPRAEVLDVLDRVEMAAAIEDIRREQAEIRREQAELREELRKTSELTEKINEMTEEMVDLFAAAKGAFKMLGYIGTGIKWVGGVVAAVVALWVAIKTGFPPK